MSKRELQMSPPEHAEVYIAGPLFNPEENNHNRALAALFRAAGYTVFNPIEDGIEAASTKDIPDAELVRKIHALDFSRVMAADIFVANLNGSQVDDGTAAESGMAYVSKVGISGEENPENSKLLIGYFNDTRVLVPGLMRNPLVIGSFDAIFATREEIIAYALKYKPPRRRGLRTDSK